MVLQWGWLWLPVLTHQVVQQPSEEPSFISTTYHRLHRCWHHSSSAPLLSAAPPVLFSGSWPKCQFDPNTNATHLSHPLTLTSSDFWSRFVGFFFFFGYLIWNFWWLVMVWLLFGWLMVVLGGLVVISLKNEFHCIFKYTTIVRWRCFTENVSHFGLTRRFMFVIVFFVFVILC